MNKSQPIKNKEKLDRFKNFYIEEEYNPRNYMFISLGLNTALRVSDLLKFTWNDVYNFDNDCFRTHVKLTEQKTTKQSVIFLNSRIINSLSWYKSKALIKFLPDTFCSQMLIISIYPARQHTELYIMQLFPAKSRV